MTIKQLFSGLSIQEIKSVFNLLYWQGINDASVPKEPKTMEEVHSLAMRYALEMLAVEEE